MAKIPTAEELEKMSFDQALMELNNLVRGMENGQRPLEDLIADFEHGSLLLKSCREKLGALEKKIEILTKDNGESGEWSPYTVQDASVPRSEIAEEKMTSNLASPAPTNYGSEDSGNPAPF